MTDSIKIKSLYKLFGPKPQKCLSHLDPLLSKEEILDQYGHVLALNNVNIDLPLQKISVIMGLSGSGKSTLIRHINRLIEPTQGKIEIDGQNILALNKQQLLKLRRKKIAMVFQGFGLFPHYTVIENAAYGAIISGTPKTQAHKAASQWLERIGLSGLEAQYPSQLSGGMKQRVGLARALTTDADILLMDEAFSALDPLIRYDMQNILLELQEELQKTIVFITHDLDEAIRLGDQITILKDGQVEQQGNAQNIVLQPKNDYIFSFVKDINRGRALWVKSVIDEGLGKHCNGPDVLLSTCLEDALQILMNLNEQKVNVVDKNHQLLGYITLKNVIQALARPKIGEENSAQFY